MNAREDRACQIGMEHALGTWSVQPFGNDDAADWAYALEDTDGLEPVQEAIDAVLGLEGGELEAPEAAGAIAAIELVACLLGRPGDTETYTEAADEWLQRTTAQPDETLRRRAVQALDRVITPPSELDELWREGDAHAQWLAEVADLRARVAVGVD